MAKADFLASVEKDTEEIKSKVSGTILPSGYFSKNGYLYSSLEKIVRGEIEVIETMICRQTPIITRSFSNIETSQLYHEISWLDNGQEHKEVVTAGDLSTKNKLIELSNTSLAVHEGNAKQLILYFDTLNMANSKEREKIVERIGYIKNEFIHPLIESNTSILPSDFGEKQLLEGFAAKGSATEWIGNVLNPIKKHPKALLMVLSSFASVLLKDLKIDPFIVDMSGATSRGKTTVLKVCASVWGNDDLVSEWNLTKVSVERKASFLNSYPLILDDTRKADIRQLRGFIYNFSGGRGKGRGSVNGSQKELTWSNILLSTGETSISDHATNAGGVAARVIPLVGLPFENVDFNFFNMIYSNIENYHGAIGIDFLNHYLKDKNDYIEGFKDFNKVFQEKAQGNEVISRIARNYAAIVFTGNLMNHFFNAGIELDVLNDYFDEMNESNKALDKPMELLENMLQELDADRRGIYNGYVSNVPIKAVYRNGTLSVLPSYLKEFLGGEEKAIRSEWLRRGITIGKENRGKQADYIAMKIQGKTYRVVEFNKDIIQELGFDFKEESSN